MQRLIFLAFSCILGLEACHDNNPTVSMLLRQDLAYPSASTLEILHDTLMIIGDDAPFVLMLDKERLQVKDTIRISQDSAYRLPKPAKHDIESSCIASYKGRPCVLAMGSCSAPRRHKQFYFPLDRLHQFDTTAGRFDAALSRIPEVNIEGMTAYKDYLLLANRANETQQKNMLLCTTWFNDQPSLIWETELRLPKRDEGLAGISGLYYDKTIDRLYFCASVERTASATQDGEIMGSYIGWISHFSTRQDKVLTPDQYIDLNPVDQAFKKSKIESIAVEKQESGILIWLVADNDDGRSSIYKLFAEEATI